MNKRYLLSLSLLVALAIALTFFKVPIASSQGLTLVAAQMSGDLPATDPNSDLWQKATAVQVPLSAQNVTRPILLDTRVKSVTTRALHNGSQIVILVEWADETRNEQMVRVQDFRDAVAVQFPLAEGQPFFCMGQLGGNVNIWHWKADWQADIAALQDMETLYPNMYTDQYPFAVGALPAPADYTDANYVPALASGNLFAAVHASPVEDVIAGGFGSLTAQPADGQNVQGFGAWAAGKWQVIFSRDLTSKEQDDAAFTPGKMYSIAFAAWDGENNERNGQKSTSQWISLQVEGAAKVTNPPASGSANSQMNLQVILVLFGPIALIVLLTLGLVGIVFLISKLPD